MLLLLREATSSRARKLKNTIVLRFGDFGKQVTEPCSDNCSFAPHYYASRNLTTRDRRFKSNARTRDQPNDRGGILRQLCLQACVLALPQNYAVRLDELCWKSRPKPMYRVGMQNVAQKMEWQAELAVTVRHSASPPVECYFDACQSTTNR